MFRPSRAPTPRPFHACLRPLTLAACVLACLALLPAPAAARTSPAPRTSPVLALGSGYASPHGSPRVRTLQRDLERAGERPGAIDGRYGPITQHAVARFQADRGLILDGIAGPQTLGALAHPELLPGAGYPDGGSPEVRMLQRRLAAAHEHPGPIDGLYGPRTDRAVKRWQHTHHQPATGVADPQTYALLTHPPRAARHPAHRPRPRTPATPPARTAPPAPPAHHATPRTRPSPTAVPVLTLIIALLSLLLGALLITSQRRSTPPTTAEVTAAVAPPPQAQAVTDPEKPEAVTEPEAATEPPEPEALTEPPEPEAVAEPLEPEEPAQPAQPAEPPHPEEPEPRAPDPALAEPDDAARAQEAADIFAVAVRLQARGDLRSAWAEYLRADARGHPEAASNLGVILQNQGDLPAAEAAFRRADERGSMYGAYNLGVLLERGQRIFAAMSAYARAAQRGHGAAASNLGVLLERGGDITGAERAYRRADNLGDAHGAFNLGVLLEEHGHHQAALGAYARASQRGSSTIANAARQAHQTLRKRQFPPAIQRRHEP